MPAAALCMLSMSKSCAPHGKDGSSAWYAAVHFLSACSACYVGLPRKYQIYWANSTQQTCSDQWDWASAVSTAVRDRLQHAIFPGYGQKLKYSSQKGWALLVSSNRFVYMKEAGGFGWVGFFPMDL